MQKELAIWHLKEILSNLSRENEAVHKMKEVFTPEFQRGYESCISDLEMEINEAVIDINNTPQP